MPPITPWSEFVANPDIRGMLLQIPLPEGRGYLWGEIASARFENERLTFELAWVSSDDPRRQEVEKKSDVEPIVVYPKAKGPFYIGIVAFVLRDLLTQQDFYIHPPGYIPSEGRLTKFDKYVDRAPRRVGGIRQKRRPRKD